LHPRIIRGRHILAFLSLLGLIMALATPASAQVSRSARSQASRPAMLEITGQVRNGTALQGKDDTGIIVPQGLPAVAHAKVFIPQLSRTTTTNAQGNFSLTVPPATAQHALTVEVTAPGFGTWRETGIKMAAINGTSLYVQLDRAAQSLTAPRPGRQPFNGPARHQPHQGSTPDAFVSCGHNSSGWTSQTETPPTIRVYMTGTGDIVTYNFQFYEQHVLPNEWGTGAPYAALQAGAEAVRDYAWYFVLNGSKGTAANVNPCSFDVDDSTAYQDFVPSGPTSTNTNNAVTSTATTVFSHGGTITETSYCSNFLTGCGADTPADACGQLATGSRMSQIGSDSCANKGDSWEQILSIYYYPGYTLTASQNYQIAFQANNSHLWYDTPSNSGNRDTGLGMAADTSPSIAASGEVAFQANNNHLWLYDPSTGASRDTGLGLEGDTSPAIVSLSGGGYEIAFQANNNHLWLYNPSTGASTGTTLGMQPSTSPAITAIAGGSYEVAFQANNNDLWYYTTTNSGNRDTGLGMDASTSPAITATSSGSPEIAFQANNNHLWYYTPSNSGSRDTGLGMDITSSPAIVSLPGNGYEIAFQANNFDLWLYTPSNSGSRDTSLGMDAASSPAITASTSGSPEVAFQANNNHLWYYTTTNSGNRDTSLGMTPDSSPALPAP
jgi:uncharacterized protein YneR